MNIIGIEHRRAFTIVGLAEDDQLPQLVGDRKRSVIPNAACVHNGVWGSDAVNDPEANWEILFGDDVWSGTPAEYFWTRLNTRLLQFLGGVDSNVRSYETWVASSTDYGALLEQSARVGGFDHIAIIDPPRAALARWLSSQVDKDELRTVVSVATIGDTTAEVAAFEVLAGPIPEIMRSSGMTVTSGAGVSFWLKRVLDEVTASLSGSPPPQLRLQLWQSAMEFGDRLRRAAPGSTVRWFGPLENQLTSPVLIRADSAADWPEMTALVEWLPLAIHGALREIRADSADVFILAGAGAAWPIPKINSEFLPSPTISDDPVADIALGAAWWPRVKSHVEIPQQVIAYAPPPPAFAPEARERDEFDDLLDQHLNEADPFESQ